MTAEEHGWLIIFPIIAVFGLATFIFIWVIDRDAAQKMQDLYDDPFKDL